MIGKAWTVVCSGRCCGEGGEQYSERLREFSSVMCLHKGSKASNKEYLAPSNVNNFLYKNPGLSFDWYLDPLRFM